jgi:hypothetical protein
MNSSNTENNQAIDLSDKDQIISLLYRQLKELQGKLQDPAENLFELNPGKIEDQIESKLINQNGQIETEAESEEDLDSLPKSIDLSSILIKDLPENENPSINIIETMKLFKNQNSENNSEQIQPIMIDESTHIPENINLGVFSLSYCGGCNSLKKQLDAQKIAYINLQLDDAGGRDPLIEQKFEENKAKYGYGATVPQIIVLDDFPVGDYKADLESKNYQQIFGIAKEFVDCKKSKNPNCFKNFLDSYKSAMEDFSNNNDLLNQNSSDLAIIGG